MRPMPSGDSMHRRRMPDYPSHDMKRRHSPGREADMRPRKRMRFEMVNCVLL